MTPASFSILRLQVTPGLPATLLYEGEWVKGIRQGKGTYKYASGEEYTGEWYMNERHGQGNISKQLFKQGGVRRHRLAFLYLLHLRLHTLMPGPATQV